jgi:hypothetical protein
MFRIIWTHSSVMHISYMAFLLQIQQRGIVVMVVLLLLFAISNMSTFHLLLCSLVIDCMTLCACTHLY